jgi:toxin ParE1/3/4
MPRRIHERLRAKADRLDIWLYIAEDSQSAADRLIDRILEIGTMLADYPEAGRQRPELGTDVRSYPIDSYIVYYVVAPGRIEVLRVLHAARDVKPEMMFD